MFGIWIKRKISPYPFHVRALCRDINIGEDHNKDCLQEVFYPSHEQALDAVINAFDRGEIFKFYISECS